MAPLIPTFDRGMRRIEKSLQLFRQPVIAARLAPFRAHALLHDAPVAFTRDDEGMQIEIETILHGGTVDLRHQATCMRER